MRTYTLLALAALALAACSDDGGSSSTAPQPEPESCTAGFVGCECLDGVACWPGSDWVCDDGTCREPSCTQGTEGCACFPNNSCHAGPDGEPLACASGVCAPRICAPGTLGCPCGEGGFCADALRCSLVGDELACAPGDCDPGSEGCVCGDGRECDGGLICARNACIAPSCIPGAEGCWCRQDLSCGGGLECTDDDLCAPIGCTAGSLGCACDSGRCTAPDAYCDEGGTCQQAECLSGQEGCPCLDGTECATDGPALFCADGTCRTPDCAPGEPGCACRGGASCELGSHCRDGNCLLDGCTAGSEHCNCAAGACHPGLRCRQDNVCADATGSPSGACYEDGTCDRGGRCDDDICVRCTLGTPGCACNDADACVFGAVCAGERCVAEQDTGDREIPDPVVCYTPCGDSPRNDIRRCDSDGLLEGCTDGRECRDGSCLRGDELARDCSSEFDCPFYQACIQGHCYAECRGNDDCADGLSCYKKVCRPTCDDDSRCPARHQCETTDGNNGFCVPTVPADGEDTGPVGDFSLSTDSLLLTDTSPEGAFQIINDSPRTETFRVRALRHDAMDMRGGGSAAVRVRDGAVAQCQGPRCRCDADDECEDPDNRCAQGLCRPRSCAEGTCPLSWLTFAVRGGEPERTEELLVEVPPGQAVTVVVGGAGETDSVRWEGSLEIDHVTMGSQEVYLVYNEIPEGHWAGEMIYLGTFGTRGLEAWSQGDKSDVRLLESVGNALVQRWGAVRRGRISWEEFEAALQATKTGSWQYPNVQEACEAEACYLYDIGVVGVARFSNDLDSVPVPTGVVELPFGVNLRFPDPVETPELMTGAVDPTKALQYAGAPAVSVRFANDPTGCSDRAFGACLTYVEEFEFDALVGGRYPTSPDDTGCAGNQGAFRAFEVPTLVPGFTRGTFLDGDTGRRYRYECRDGRAPLQGRGAELENLSLAGANPVPDGQARRRTLRVLDGALVNQSQLFLLFEERYESFFDGDDDGFSAYGYVMLERRGGETDATDDDEDGIADVFQGAELPEGDRPAAPDLVPTCSPELLERITGDRALDGDNVANAVHVLIEGRPIDDDAEPLVPGGFEQVHYLCEATGQFDGGPDAPFAYLGQELVPNDESCARWSGNGRCDDGGPGSERGLCRLGTDRTDCGLRYDHEANAAVACPEGTGVRYFTLDAREWSQEDIAGLPCQQSATCVDQFVAWAQSPGTMLQIDLSWECVEGDYCDDNRSELRAGKRFFAENEFRPLLSLRSLTDEAFRYETQFRGRDGAGIGFTPEVCDPEPNVTPYCYDPVQIEQIQERVDCLLHVHRTWYDTLDDPQDDDRRLARDLLNSYLTTNFSIDEEIRDGQSVFHDGFERQVAQLFIMLGDDALARASFSRYDLARINGAAFEGSRLETDGVDLSGPVGFEMDSLYRSAQYYQTVLDRFYRLSPVLFEALGHGRNARNFVSPDTVILYLDRVIASSTQKARAYGEIARRYQQLGESALARRVAQRAYTSAYLESILMTRMMLRVVDVSFAEDRRAIRGAVEDAQRRYRSALLDMETVHSELEDGLTVFGFTEDYVPFPALDREDFRQSNAFEILLNRARAKIQAAREREELAINSDREFETSQAQFQAELGQLRNNYEGQLGEICGTFVANDRVYPAIRKYADLSEDTSVLGDPCGLVNNGQISGLYAQLNDLRLEVTGLSVAYSNVFDEMEIERQRVSDYCDETLEFAEMVYQERSDILSLQDDIREAQQAIGQIQATSSSISSGIQSGPAGLVSFAAQGGVYVFEEKIQRAERRIADSELAIQQWEFEQQCELAEIDSQARIATSRLRLRELDVEGLKIEARMRTVASEILRTQNLAKRLQIEQEETEALQVNVQAAHNNPNVRIFRNDAILNAEISFDDAIRELYKLTRVFEYYTSQSYPDLADLFLIRLVARGDLNLENYLSDIENAFFEFEEFFGNPATRVQIVSLKDDILSIPHVDGNGDPLSESDRTRMLRDRLTDPALLDANGYITMSFSTNLDDLSPLTRNHKLLYVEADVYGNDTGDYVARLYLRSQGSGVIHSVDDDLQYYRFDPRTAVLNTIFGGVRYFDPSVYQSYRHRDRPFVNTQWELVMNQRDERANQDVNLRSVTDIRLYLYYTDVTVF